MHEAIFVRASASAFLLLTRSKVLMYDKGIFVINTGRTCGDETCRIAGRKQSDLFGFGQYRARVVTSCLELAMFFHAVLMRRAGLSCRSFLSAKTRREARQLRADPRTGGLDLPVFLSFN